MTAATDKLIEHIQRRAFTLVGRDAVEAAISARRFATPPDDAENLTLDMLRMALPEHIYHPDRLLAEHRNPQLARFDREIFHQRFWNLAELCHRHFEDGLSRPRLSIRIATLPFSQINGVCFFTAELDRVVLLNEGLLYCAPELLRPLLRMCRLKDHYARLEAGDDTAVHEELAELSTEAIQPFIRLLIDVVCAGTSTLDLVEGEHNDHHLRTNDTWKVQEWLRHNISTNEPIEDFSVPDSDLPDNALQYYACRGLFAVILGHEFAHFYHGHHAARDQSAILRSQEECLATLEEVCAYLDESDIDPAAYFSRQYLIDQPTEIEADVEGFRCVARYCRDNGLGRRGTEAVITGALSAFWLMEWVDRLMLLLRHGVEQAMAYADMPHAVRNSIEPREHPCPLSRVASVMEQLRDDGEYAPFAEAAEPIWDDMLFSLEWMWIENANLLHQALGQRQNPMGGCVSRAPLFEGLRAVGCFDV